MQSPRAPVHRRRAVYELLNNSGSTPMSFDEILDLNSASVHHDTFRVCTMEKHVSHDRLLRWNYDRAFHASSAFSKNAVYCWVCGTSSHPCGIFIAITIIS